MPKDPVVEEVRRIRDAYAQRFDYDLDRICRNLQEQQRRDTHQHVSLPPKRVQPAVK